MYVSFINSKINMSKWSALYRTSEFCVICPHLLFRDFHLKSKFTYYCCGIIYLSYGMYKNTYLKTRTEVMYAQRDVCIWWMSSFSWTGGWVFCPFLSKLQTTNKYTMKHIIMKTVFSQSWPYLCIGILSEGFWSLSYGFII